MSVRYREADIVQKTTLADASGMFAVRERADARNIYNNNIHYHSFWELEFIISGDGVYEINNIAYPIKRGMLYLTTPADYHTYSLAPDESFDFFCVQFRSEHIEKAVSSLLYSCTEPIAVSFDGDRFEEMYASLDRLIRVFSEKQPMYELVTRNLIENICIEASYEAVKRQPRKSEDDMIRNAVIFVKNNYRGRITLRDAAERAGLSEAYFSHIFSTVMGMGFSSYVRSIRLDAAANLLKSTELTVKEICYKTGFGNRNYFTEAFRAHFGMSPREYRDAYVASQNVSPADGDVKDKDDF